MRVNVMGRLHGEASSLNPRMAIFGRAWSQARTLAAAVPFPLW